MDDSRQPFVYVIIVNWNRLEDTMECIESVQKITYSHYKILLVDNASTEDISGTIRERYPSVVLIRNEKNLGFSGGNNVAIRHALGHGTQYVWLLNNDTVVEPDALNQLVQVGERDTKAGVIGSKIYYYDRPDVISFAGATIDWENGRSPHIGRGEVDNGKYDAKKEVDRLSGCSMLVKRDVCEKIGLLDEEFFLFVEDVDWCVRARKEGYRCVFVPDSIVRHKEGRSHQDDNLKYRIFSYYNTRNFLLLIRKTFSFPKRHFLILRVIINKIRKQKKSCLKMPFSGIFPSVKVDPGEAAVLLGIRDFFLNRFGKAEYITK